MRLNETAIELNDFAGQQTILGVAGTQAAGRHILAHPLHRHQPWPEAAPALTLEAALRQHIDS